MTTLAPKLRRLLSKMASNQLRFLCQKKTSTFASLLSPLLSRYSCHRVVPYRVVSYGLTMKKYSNGSGPVNKMSGVHYEPGVCRVSTLKVDPSIRSSRGDLETLYRLRWIKYLRFISRVKILHVAVVTALTWPMSYWYTQGIVSTSSLTASVVAATATTVGLFLLSYFFRRIVGQIDVKKSNETVVISTLSFWGNRRNNVFSLSNVVPLTESGFEPKDMFHRLEVYNSPYVYLWSLRYGEICDYDSLFKVIGLRLDSSNKGRKIPTRIQKIKNTDTAAEPQD